MRRRRLARLAGLGTNNAALSFNSTSVPTSPDTPGPSNVPPNLIIPPLSQIQPQNQVSMDVEETSEKQCIALGLDVDSGIENMEVEESDRKEATPRSRVSWKINQRIINRMFLLLHLIILFLLQFLILNSNLISKLFLLLDHKFQH